MRDAARELAQTRQSMRLLALRFQRSFAAFLLELEALGDVTNGGQHELALAVGDGAESDLGRELRTVTTPPRQRESGSHGSRRRPPHVPRAQIGMPASELLWHQTLHGLAHELGSSPPEQMLHLIIRVDNQALGVTTRRASGADASKPRTTASVCSTATPPNHVGARVLPMNGHILAPPRRLRLAMGKVALVARRWAVQRPVSGVSPVPGSLRPGSASSGGVIRV